jgi:hypothetical protein
VGIGARGQGVARAGFAAKAMTRTIEVPEVFHLGHRGGLDAYGGTHESVTSRVPLCRVAPPACSS